MSDSSVAKGRWKTFSERSLYESQWVSLVKVEVEPPDGRRFEHHVVRLQRVALCVVCDVRGRVLMLRRHRFVTDQMGLELPGGIVEPDETSVEAAAREVEEETGWRPHGLTQLIEFQPMVGMVDTPHEVYLSTHVERVGEPTDLQEAGSVEWIDLADVPDLIGKGEILGSGSIVGLLYYLNTRAS